MRNLAEPLNEGQHNLIFIEQGRNAFFVNVILNGLIAYLLLGGSHDVPLWAPPAGGDSMSLDIVLTSILLCALMCLITTPILNGQLKAGKHPALSAAQRPSGGPGKRSVWFRALLLAVLGVTLAAAPLLFLLSALGIDSMPGNSYVILKALWAGVLAACIGPWIAWWALVKFESEPSTVAG